MFVLDTEVSFGGGGGGKITRRLTREVPFIWRSFSVPLQNRASGM